MSGKSPHLSDECRRLKRINDEYTLLHLKSSFELEQERQRIVGALYDEVAQPLVGARLRAESLKRSGVIKDTELEDILSAITASVRKLSSSLLPDGSYLNTPEEALYALGKNCAKRYNASCYMDVPCKLFTTLAGYHVVYQMVNEMLNGTMGIYHADVVWIWLKEKSGRLEIMTVDNGTLFEINDILFPDESTSVPFLVRVEEAVRCLGGEMVAERTQDNRQTTILLPLCMDLPA